MRSDASRARRALRARRAPWRERRTAEPAARGQRTTSGAQSMIAAGRARHRLGHSGAPTVRRGIRGLRTRLRKRVWFVEWPPYCARCGHDREGSRRGRFSAAWCAGAGLAITPDRSDGASSTAAPIVPRHRIRKTCGRGDRVCYAGRDSWARPATCARRCAAESQLFQIGSHAVPSQRCHTADGSPGRSPQRSIPVAPSGLDLTPSDEISKDEKLIFEI